MANGIKGMAKTAGGVLTSGVIALPLAIPAFMVAKNVTSGQTVEYSVYDAMRNTVGLNTRTGAIDWQKAIGYGMMSAAAVGLGLLARKYIVKRM